MGSDKITLHYKKGVMVADSRDLMIFPKKYNYKQRVYGDNFPYLANNLEGEQLFGVKTILGKAMKKGKPEEVAQSLIEDFPKMQEEIEKI